MKKEFTVLIPITQDKDVGNGNPHKAFVWKEFEDDLTVLFEAYSRLKATMDGVWRDPKGNLVCDESRIYKIAVKQKDINKLKTYLQKACQMFHQQCLYVESGGEVEFIEGS